MVDRAPTPESYQLLKFAESWKPNGVDVLIETKIIGTLFERQKTDEIRLKEVIIYSRVFPQEKTDAKVGAAPRTEAAKMGRDFPEGNQSIIGWNPSVGASGSSLLLPLDQG